MTGVGAQLAERLDALTAQVASLSAAEDRRVQADETDEQRVDAVALEARIDRLHHEAAAHAALDAALDDRLSRLEGASTEGGAARAAEVAALRAASAAQAERIDALAGLDRGAAALLDVLREELARVDGQSSQRLDRLAERISAASEARRWEAQALDDRLARLEAGADELRSDLGGSAEHARDLDRAHADLRHDLDRASDEVGRLRQSVDALGSGDVERIEAVEKAVAAREAEVADLYDFHAALDAGMGELRAELANIRRATGSLAEAQGGVQDRLDSLFEARQAAEATAGRGRRAGRKSAAAADSADVFAALADLARGQQELGARLDALVGAAQSATRSAAQASSQAAAVHPLRSEVKALAEQVGAQNQALAALRRSVGALSAKLADPAPAPAKRAPRAPK